MTARLRIARGDYGASTAGVTHEVRRSVAGMGAEQIVAPFAGERPPRLVNPQAWAAYQARRPRFPA